MMKYPQIGHRQFMERLQPLYTPEEMEKIETAYAFSKYAHRGQARDSGLRYFEHPRAVAWILIDELGIVDWQMIVLALLHDVLEDSFLLSESRVELNFGKRILIGLKLLTKEPEDGYLERLERHAIWQVLFVKLADRLHNLRTLDDCTPDKRERKVKETRTEYLPLLNHLMIITPKSRRAALERLNKDFFEALATLEGDRLDA